MKLPHPQPDDDEPITAEWWAETFKTDYLVLNLGQTIQRFGRVPVLVCHDDKLIARFQPHDEPLYQVTTRGQLRVLLAVLGWGDTK